MSDNKEYDLRTVADFTKIPEDKLQACFADFVEFLSVARNPEEFNKRLQTAFDLPENVVTFDNTVFRWCDDDQRVVSSIDFTVKETGEHVGRLDL